MKCKCGHKEASHLLPLMYEGNSEVKGRCLRYGCCCVKYEPEPEPSDEPLMEVKDIVADWLKRHGYDGLTDGGGQCGCLVDDLMPCGEMGRHCVAGYKGPPSEEWAAEGAEWCVYPGRRVAEEGGDDGNV